MKLLTFFLLLIFSATALSRDVFVQGYQNKNGDYVAPHTRSAPDTEKWNNYGRPSSSDIQQEQSIYGRDYDSDSLRNQNDYDDDNDGTLDDYEN